MDCRAFEESLELWLEDGLAVDERRAAEDHLRVCPVCRELDRMAGDLGRFPRIEPPGDLADEILQRTTGRPCARAEGLLCSYVDGSLTGADEELVGLHLGGCKECAALACAVARMAVDLPSLANLNPDDRFVDAVLAATLPLGRRLSRRYAVWIAAWGRLLRRPRVAWEMAYVGTFLLALVFIAPGSPLAGVPQMALELAKVNPVEGLSVPAAEMEADVSAGMRSVWHSTGRKAVSASRAAASHLYEHLKTDLGTLWGRLASEQEGDRNDTPPAKEDSPEGDRT